MKKINDLEEVITYIRRKHPGIHCKNGGCYSIKFIRTETGSRIPFEESKGFRLIDFHVSDDSLIIDQMASGIVFKGNYRQTMSSRLILQNLVLINIYDHQTDFFSLNSVDFTYIENSKDAQVQLLSNWDNNKSGEIRAQWKGSNPSIERLLNSIGSYPLIDKVVDIGRNLEM